jgi:hypothetical protein
MNNPSFPYAKTKGSCPGAANAREKAGGKFIPAPSRVTH